MKTDEASQDITYYEGEKRACHALNDEGKYIIVPWLKSLLGSLAMIQ